MSTAFSTMVKFDLLKVGHCQHPECVALSGGGRRGIDFPALVGLIEHPRHGLVLYDTGYSHHFRKATRRFPECLYRWLTPVTLPPGEELLAQLESRGIRPHDIESIVISHFHADHVAGLRDFPGARFLATRAEYEDRRLRGRWGRLRRAFLRELLPPDFEERLGFVENAPAAALPGDWAPFYVGRDLLGDASMLGIDLPGHTRSQLGLGFRAEHDGAVFLVGDACWKIEALDENRPPARIAYGLFDSATEYDSTFAKLRALRDSAGAPVMIPSHCSTTWGQRGGSRRVCRA